MGFLNRIKKAYNAFTEKEPYAIPKPYGDVEYSTISFTRPDRPYISPKNERSIVNSVLNRIATDVSSMLFHEILLNEDQRYKSIVSSEVDRCLSISANVDQTGRAFMQDVALSLLDEGCVAVVPIDTDIETGEKEHFEIYSVRTGKILEWLPNQIKVSVYNERIGKRQEIFVKKDIALIIENPFHSVMNEPNSTLRRLVRKLNILDAIDEQSGSGKLDLIIQLPYTIKSELRRQQAEKRRKDIEKQLHNSKYGIAYTDGSEKITQLNRSVDNNLMKQIEYLTSMLYSQLSITTSVLDGTANAETMLNYEIRTVTPIADAIVDEMNRKWITRTAYTQGHRFRYFRDPFKFMTVNQIAEASDKLTRNEIATSNEIRDKIGLPVSMDPNADELRNKNLNKNLNTGTPTNWNSEENSEEDSTQSTQEES